VLARKILVQVALILQQLSLLSSAAQEGCQRHHTRQTKIFSPLRHRKICVKSRRRKRNESLYATALTKTILALPAGPRAPSALHRAPKYLLVSQRERDPAPTRRAVSLHLFAISNWQWCYWKTALVRAVHRARK